MRKFFLVMFLALAFVACKDNGQFKIDGTVTNSQVDKIYLEKLELQGAVPFDSAKIDKEGHFKFKGEVGCPTFFLLKLDDNRFLTLLIDSCENIIFSSDYLSFANDYKIDGSIGSGQVQTLNHKLNRTLTRIDSINALINLSQGDLNFKSKLQSWEQEKQSIYNEQSEFSKNFIWQNPFSMASILAIYQKFNDDSYVVQDLQTIKTAASALNSMYPTSTHVQALYKDTKNMMTSVNALQLKRFINENGRNSPEIKLPNTKGEDVSLSSFEGKYVLVHFWSSDDDMSRTQNAILKENYDIFKSKGFEIYQVCIDTVKSDWIKTIEEDKLTWTNVGDMEGSYSATSVYNVRTIPSNYLLDREGKIVAKDIFGPNVNATLKKVLN